jgi:hypothetical protein
MKKDLCIICGVETPYDFETHIDMRLGYIEGAGQLCRSCFNRSKDINDVTSSLDLIICVNEDTILNTPNDYELGEKVRQMYWNIKK